jgi:soluble lytic murein transglycosylase-like protein
MKWRRLCIVMAALIGEGKADPLESRCVEHTSTTWGVPVELLQAIHEVEAGKPGVKHRNPNGSVDLGSMQHNSRTAMALQKKFGVDPEMLLWSECYAVYVSGWELASSAYQHQDWRLAIAAYNAGDTAVERAVKGHGGIPKDISDLNLPHSTKFEYVPRVMEAWARYLRSKPQ